MGDSDDLDLDLDLDSTRIQVDALGHTPTPFCDSELLYELSPLLPPRRFPSLTSPC